MASQWASCISLITGRPRPRPPMARHAAKLNKRRCRRRPPQGRVPFCPQIGVSLGSSNMTWHRTSFQPPLTGLQHPQLPRRPNKPPWQLRMNPAVRRLRLVLIDEDSAPKGLEFASALGFVVTGPKAGLRPAPTSFTMALPRNLWGSPQGTQVVLGP